MPVQNSAVSRDRQQARGRLRDRLDVLFALELTRIHASYRSHRAIADKRFRDDDLGRQRAAPNKIAAFDEERELARRRLFTNRNNSPLSGSRPKPLFTRPYKPSYPFRRSAGRVGVRAHAPRRAEHHPSTRAISIASSSERFSIA